MRMGLLIGTAGLALLAAGAWLCHAPALPAALRAIGPGMPEDAARRLLGPGCVREDGCTGRYLNAEIPGTPLLHGKRRWVVVRLREQPGADPALLAVQELRTEDGFRLEWLYRVPGLERLL